MSELTLADKMRETITAKAEELDKADVEDEQEEPEVEEPEDSKEVEEPEESEETEEAETAEEPEAEEPVEQAPVDPLLVNPPNTWTAKAKTKWDSIDPEVKREIKKRESDTIRGINQYKEQATFGDRISKSITPYQPFLKAKGIPAERAVEDALNLAYQLDTSNPLQKGMILKQLAQQFGADLSVFTNQNPEQEKLYRAIAPLQQKIDQMERERQNSLYSQKLQQTQGTERLIEEFATSTDETGKLAHPFFDNVKDMMASLLESGRAKTLDDAYTIAVRADPEVSALIGSEQTKPKRIAEEAKRRADKVKRNKDVDVSRKASPQGQKSQGSMRDTMEETWQRLHG